MRLDPERLRTLQFMILLSALLASLTGFVAGERQPVRAAAQVQASSAFVTAQPEAAVVVAKARKFVIAHSVNTPVHRITATRTVAATPRVRTRLALKQSWLF